MSKFELFRCCLGNGTTCCNKAVTENGDYKIVAHISEHGVIKLYVPENYIPEKDMKVIEADAKRSKEAFMERWNKKSDIQKWEYMMNLPTIGCGFTKINIIDMEYRELSIEERVKLMEEEFFKAHM